MTGGGGNDVFVFGSNAAASGGDVITDFQAGDRVDLSGIDARVRGRQQCLHHAAPGTNAAFGGQGVLRTYQSSGNTIVEGNNDARYGSRLLDHAVRKRDAHSGRQFHRLAK